MTDYARQPPYYSETDAVGLPKAHSWTAQEHWAWARVVRGLIADMSKFDPSLERSDDFVAWLRGKYDEAGRDANAEVENSLAAWPKHRQLSATFMRLVLFVEPYNHVRARRWVRIVNAQFTETLSWENEIFDGELWVDRCRFDSSVEWRGLRIGGLLSLDGCRLASGLSADRLSTSDSFSLKKIVVMGGPVNLNGVTIGGQLSLSGAKLEQEWNADNAVVESGVFLDDCTLKGDVRCVGAKIGGAFTLSQSALKGCLHLDRLTLDGSLTCTRGFTIEKDVFLLGAKISGQITFHSAKIGGEFVGDSLVCESGLFCNDGFSANGEVRLIAARVGGQTTFKEAQFGGGLSADRLVADGVFLCTGASVAKGDLRLLGARIQGQISLTDVSLDGDLIADGLIAENGILCTGKFVVSGEMRLVGATIRSSCGLDGSEVNRILAGGISVDGDLYLRGMKRLGDVQLIGARITGAVQFNASNIEGHVDLTGASIQGELQTSQRLGQDPIWRSGARLNLRNATVGALAGGVKSFPQARGRTPAMELAGLTYARLGGLRADETKAESLAEASAAELTAWVEAGHNAQDFTPGPYRQLASALVASGHTGKANRILHAMRRHERRCAKPLRKTGLFFSGLTIGFGYRNDYAAYWFGAIVLGFAALGLLLSGPRELDLSFAGWAELARWLGFSFGNAIPLIQIDKAHETFLAFQFVTGAAEDPERFVHLVPTGVAWMYYVQKVLGFAILSFLAAGLAGAATRQRE